MTRLKFPKSAKIPRPNQAAAEISTAAPTTGSTIFGSELISRRMASTRMRASPTTIAATTYERGILSAGVKSICSWARKLLLAGSSSRQKIATMTGEMTENTSRTRGGTALMTAVSRMCPSNRYATTAPSIASQRKRMVASSSVQTSALRRT